MKNETWEEKLDYLFTASIQSRVNENQFEDKPNFVAAVLDEAYIAIADTFTKYFVELEIPQSEVLLSAILRSISALAVLPTWTVEFASEGPTLNRLVRHIQEVNKMLQDAA